MEELWDKRVFNRYPQSVEHILPESNGEDYIYLGNLSLLEPKVNEEAGNKAYPQKKVSQRCNRFFNNKETCFRLSNWFW